MKIVKLESENIKRLHAVEITPTGDIVEISGGNGNGKTSILDSIYWALAGTSHIQSEPIHRGKDAARIKLDLGELVVTRTIKRKGETEFTTSLKVESADGASYKSPQSMLDALLSSLTFDPLEFAKKKAREQFDALRALVPGVDFERIDDLNRGDFARRTEASRRHEEAKAAAGLIHIDESLADELEDEAALVDEIAQAGEVAGKLLEEQTRRNTMGAEIERGKKQVAALKSEATELRRRAAAVEAQANDLEQQVFEDQNDLLSLPPIAEPPNVADIKRRLASTQQRNGQIRAALEARKRKASLTKVANDAALLVDELSGKIKERNQAKQEAISKAQMPVEGLGFGDGFITLNGLPFDQASDAEQLRASIAIAMKSNSKLKVIRVRDGSLLDDKSMGLLTAMAAENECQVWVETVRAVTDAAIVIEDGRIKGSNAHAGD